MLKAKDLRELSEKELETKLHSLEQELYNLRFQRSTSRLDKPHLIKTARKDIARVKTVINLIKKEKDKATE
ncbi:MAG: 50S ribosomal protein L29 [Candidatus Omnitrophota bacterium]